MKITVLVQSAVMGPGGKLKVGEIISLEDSPYVRVLVKSGNVALIDPPSLETEFLIASGLIKETEIEETVVLVKRAMALPLKKEKISETIVKKTSQEEDSIN